MMLTAAKFPPDEVHDWKTMDKNWERMQSSFLSPILTIGIMLA